MRSIKRAALPGVDPVHLIGAIVGEHTYNVGGLDGARAYYVKALAYLGTTDLAFGYQGEVRHPVRIAAAIPLVRRAQIRL